MSHTLGRRRMQVHLCVGPLTIHLWQPLVSWAIGPVECQEWCCRWNFYLGPLGLEWATSEAVAERFLDEEFERYAETITAQENAASGQYDDL